MTYPGKHLFQIRLRVIPGGDSIAEKDEVLNHSSGIEVDHQTQTSEGRFLLFVVSDVPQRQTPGSDKLGETRRHLRRTVKSQTTNGYR